MFYIYHLASKVLPVHFALTAFDHDEWCHEWPLIYLFLLFHQIPANLLCTKSSKIDCDLHMINEMVRLGRCSYCGLFVPMTRSAINQCLRVAQRGILHCSSKTSVCWAPLNFSDGLFCSFLVKMIPAHWLHMPMVGNLPSLGLFFLKMMTPMEMVRVTCILFSIIQVRLNPLLQFDSGCVNVFDETHLLLHIPDILHIHVLMLYMSCRIQHGKPDFVYLFVLS